MMKRRVFRRGRGKGAALAGAALAWASAVLLLVLLAAPELAPDTLRDLLSDRWPTPTAAGRLLGLALAALVGSGGLSLWQIAPFLGGHRITVDDNGIEYTDGRAWVRAAWQEVETLVTRQDATGILLYSVKTHHGEFTFTAQNIDKAEDLAALIEVRLGNRRET